MPASPARPKSLRVGPATYTIFWSPEDWNYALGQGWGEDGCYGITRHPELRIYLNPAQADQQLQDTLLHEVLHAIWFHGSGLYTVKDQGDLEEYLVARQTPWLLLVLRDNPKVVKFLLEDL